MAKQALRVEYESFGKTHTCFISPTDIRALIDKTMPATVVEISQEGIDGLPVIAQVGKAYRSRSGKALIINTSESGGDIMTPWTSFKKVIEGKVEKARLSRLNPPPKPQPQATAQGIREGLARGF